MAASSPTPSLLPVASSLDSVASMDGPDPQRCPHIADAFVDSATKGALLRKFKTAVAWGVRRQHEALRPAKRRKIASPVCGTCALVIARPFVCLHCSYAGCWKDEHVAEHLKEEEHLFCTDAKSGAVFCIECDDFIYEPAFDSLFHATVLSVEEKDTRFQVAKRPRETYRSWTPTPSDVAALEQTVPLPCQARRGLLNLGQTCFLNVILQSFVHNPLLRNFFLSDKHNHRSCKTEKDCTSCELDKLFAKVYSPAASPFGPTSLLALTWRAASALSGYAQQDAHECLIALLNALHASSRGSTNVSCNCIVHSTFAGQLQSDVRCERCGNVNETIDPCLDISLGLGAGMNSLAGCLKRYTTPEKLGPKEYTCPHCGKLTQEASKRLSIRKLPPVLSFQFKRFEQRAGDKGTVKIDAPVRIPATINMGPYTTAAVESNPNADPNVIFQYPGPEVLYEYDLFAVINHEGQIDNGHYTNFARYQDAWYRFDDEKVTPSTLAAVLNPPSSPIYMAFYVKRRLDYKPEMKPSYILSRETEAVREREREKSDRVRKQQDRDDTEERKERKERMRAREVEDELLATV